MTTAIATKTLEFKWTTSRARDTYGYNVCTLYVNGRKVARTCGGGYDMKGTVLGDFIAKHYADRLNALQPEEMSENSHWQPDHKRVCAGECHEKWNAQLIEHISEEKGGEPPELPKLAEDCWECPVCGGETEASHDGKRVDDGRYFYGLTFHDPNFDPGTAVIGEGCNDRTLGPGAEGKTVEQAEEDGESLGLERYQAFYSASSKVPTERHHVPLIDGACGMSSVERIMEAIGLKLRYIPTRKKNDSIHELIDESL